MTFNAQTLIQILETAFELMVAYCKVPHGQACDPQINTVNRPFLFFEHSSKELPEHYVRTCVQFINRLDFCHPKLCVMGQHIHTVFSQRLEK